MPLRFLVDESCDYIVVQALRQAGHDVLAVVESLRGAEDQKVAEYAWREKRIVITEDKDFGRLVYAQRQAQTGVVLVRFPASRRADLCPALLSLIQRYENQLAGTFVVLQPERVRFRKLPE
ncbi:DUF5615 family PIN-like protein [Rhodothermus marinus]|uniref:DUF5615 family PIN-like protein n=1 Tax=Rhodothermus marinus TaxID=29549 RepID=UPI0037C7C93E